MCRLQTLGCLGHYEFAYVLLPPAAEHHCVLFLTIICLIDSCVDSFAFVYVLLPPTKFHLVLFISNYSIFYILELQ